GWQPCGALAGAPDAGHTPRPTGGGGPLSSGTRTRSVTLRRRCGEAGAPSPLRFGAAEWGGSIGRRARRLIGAPTAPRLPAALFGPARVPHVIRRHAASKQAMALRRFMLRGVTKVGDEWALTRAP